MKKNIKIILVLNLLFSPLFLTAEFQEFFYFYSNGQWFQVNQNGEVIQDEQINQNRGIVQNQGNSISVQNQTQNKSQNKKLMGREDLPGRKDWGGTFPKQADDFITLVKNREENREKLNFEVTAPNILLLPGPPGIGKTYLIRIIAKELGCRFYECRAADFESKYAGQGREELESILKELTDEAVQYKQPVFIYFDECNSLLCQRQSDQTVDRVLTARTETLMKYLDTYKDSPYIFFAFSTNFKTELDRAFVDRVDMIIMLDYPDKQGRIDILKVQFRNRYKKEYQKSMVKRIKKLSKYIAERTDYLQGRNLESLTKKIFQGHAVRSININMKTKISMQIINESIHTILNERLMIEKETLQKLHKKILYYGSADNDLVREIEEKDRIIITLEKNLERIESVGP